MWKPLPHLWMKYLQALKLLIFHIYVEVFKVMWVPPNIIIHVVFGFFIDFP